MFAMIAASILIANGPVVVAPTAPAAVAAPVDPKKMSQAEIRAHNANLGKTDPNYIRCVRSTPIGSLVARDFSCRTVAQWNQADAVGNDEVRRVADAMAGKAVNTN